MPPEQMLLKWFNFHLANAGCSRTVSNWSGDLKDSELYAVLLSQLEPKRVGPSLVSKTLEEEDLHNRAELVLSAAEQLGCRKFVTPNEIVQVCFAGLFSRQRVIIYSTGESQIEPCICGNPL